MKTRDDKTLLLKVADGNEKAFFGLYDFYWEKLYSVVIAIVKNHNDAEDVVQDVFISLWQNRGALVNIRELKPYLITIARNRAIKVLLKSKQLPASLDSFIHFADSCGYSLDKEYDAKELARIINLQVENLPDKMKEIFVLSRENGLSNKEIADSLNISEHTVKKQINNSIKRIRSQIRFLIIFLFP
ncbi:MAG TPA: RNA polymerase sigma-70 factor [Sphingobacterium sp.]|nr:RNA polymerase sigma-70 factor [Sphingobacterium sp.]